MGQMSYHSKAINEGRIKIIFPRFSDHFVQLQKVEISGVGILSYSYHILKYIPDSNDQLLISSPHAALQHHSQTRNPPGLQKTAMSS